MNEKLSNEEVRRIMSIDIETLAETQFQTYRQFAISQLEEMILNLKFGNWDAAKKMVAFSKAGDGWGNENYFINFAVPTAGDQAEDEGVVDIMDVIENLKSLDETRHKHYEEVQEDEDC